MSSIARIVWGGGWKGTRVRHVKVKAWNALFFALGFAMVAVNGVDSFWSYASVPAGICFVLAVFWFLREKPRPVTFPTGSVRGDDGNLHVRNGMP
jgi:hypothetical protein